MAIQTLVENSIKHAIGASSKPGNVAVRVIVVGGQVVAEVSDSGSGFDESKIIAGHGLDTLRARLEAIRTRTSRLRVHVPLEVAARLDGLGFDLQLMPLGPGQFAIYRGRGVVLGGNQPDEPTAMLKGAAVSNAVHRLTDPES